MPSERSQKIRQIIRVASGNLLEMYDFTIFAYYAPQIAKAFFPTATAVGSLLLTLMTFGAGFLMRPLGAIVLGAYIDRHGRRQGLLVTLALMSLGTVMLACVPGYATIGLAAPILVLAGRLIQGFSAGAELGGVSVYLAEIATPGNKGFYVSWQSASQQLVVVLAAALGYALRIWLPPADIDAWGWRLPMLFGCIIIPFLFVIRRTLVESDEFLARQHHPTLAQLWSSLLTHLPTILLSMMLVTMSTVSFYMITAYTPTYAGKELHLDDANNLLVIAAVGISNFLWLPIMGALSDRIGRRPILLTMTMLSLLTVYPAMLWLVDGPSMTKLLVVELWFSFIYASYNGAMIVFLTEVMPLPIRTSGFSLAYSLATALFGGFTPAISTYLIQSTGNRAIPGLWLMAAAASGLLATLRLRPSLPSTK